MPVIHQRDVQASQRQPVRAKSLRSRTGAVEARCLRGKRAQVGASERKEEERRRAHSNL